MADITLHICTTCRQMDTDSLSETREGALLFEAISKEELPENVSLKPVECLSSCDQGCNIAISSATRWSYVYGKLDPSKDVPDILAGLRAYANTSDGIVPWRERPIIFRKQSIARIPPIGENS